MPAPAAGVGAPRPPRFLFASDSFKGTLSSARIAELLRDAALEVFPNASCRSVEMADGGEGTVAAVVAAAGGTLVEVTAAGPLGDPVTCSYGLLGDGRAIVEMAAASGLPLVGDARRDPLLASTYGTGQLVVAALDAGARDLTVGLGGSATNDGGMGALRALGVRFLDVSGRELAGRGADLASVVTIDVSGLDPRLRETRLRVMCDVDNPLLGPSGATRTFGRQKGATPGDLDLLENGMASYAGVLERTCGLRVATMPGAGAAGGLAAGLVALAGAELTPGVECVLDLAGFDGALAGCDLCVTGEGHADAQTAHGKVVAGVARRCAAAGVPCVAVVGGMDASATELLGMGVTTLVPTVIDACPLSDALGNAERNYRLAAQRVFSLVKVGRVEYN